jgi:hypothetical protein
MVEGGVTEVRIDDDFVSLNFEILPNMDFEKNGVGGSQIPVIGHNPGKTVIIIDVTIWEWNFEEWRYRCGIRVENV